MWGGGDTPLYGQNRHVWPLNILPLSVLCNQCEQLMLCCLKHVILEKEAF